MGACRHAQHLSRRGARPAVTKEAGWVSRKGVPWYEYTGGHSCLVKKVSSVLGSRSEAFVPPVRYCQSCA